MAINDNEPPLAGTAFPPSDAYGHAALLLVESLIHGLCEQSILSTRQAIEIVERAISVEFDFAEAADGAGAPLWRSLSLLSSIATSLEADDCRRP